MTPDAERRRLAEADRVPWRRWGPYLAERAWGSVREDYSASGDAWSSFPHDHARSRAYRWTEDGMAGICDDVQTLCLALALWNGCDPILKERIFGLSGPEGNHGEDAKEYWWFLDATPTSSYLRWRYVYPQEPFPYERLVEENRRRTRMDPEFELLDTGVFDADRYWDVGVEYAKASPDDICMLITVRNAGDRAAQLDVLPTLWFRNTWSWGYDRRCPALVARDGCIVADHRVLGRFTLAAEPGARLLFCDNESNARRLWGADGPAYPKDGIADHIVHGKATVNPAQTGTKAAAHHRLQVAPGTTCQLRLRLCAGDAVPDLGDSHAATLEERRRESDDFHAGLVPAAGIGADEAAVLRQALAGMLWSKQFYSYNVQRWLDGDPAYPPPPPQHAQLRNGGWRHVNCHEVLAMPDTWEYPWFAAWDLAFHCVILAHVDPEFAKQQMLLLCREWYMHPNGQLPAYEWSFSDVNPPVHALAAMAVYTIDGGHDHEFLERVFHKLLINFTWWVNRKDTEGNNLFEGGFLGLDNIGPFDRSMVPAHAGHLEQSDGTAWMAVYCLSMLELALTLACSDRTYEDVATKFFEHFTLIAAAMEEQGLWDEEDGFYYDVLRSPDGGRMPLRAHSAVGLMPLCAVTVLDPAIVTELPEFAARMRWFLHNSASAQVVSHIAVPGVDGRQLLSIVSPGRLRRILACMLDESEFLSPHGVRALSRRHRDRPLTTTIDGASFTLDYEPGESTSGLFGGNSNWRGPVWMPLNVLFIAALQRFHAHLGDDYRVEHPAQSGIWHTLAEVADDLTGRLISLFTLDTHGRRPCFGDSARFRTDPAWRDALLFHEYFHGDTGAGLGASHQTGWTGLVAHLIRRRGMPWTPPTGGPR